MKARPLIHCLGISLLLFLAACGSATPLPSEEAAIETPAESAESAAPAVEESNATVTPFDFGMILAGTPMEWTDGSTLVYVPAGDFSMGLDEQDPSDHSPAHTVTLSGFWIQQAEVTNQMYAQCVALGVCSLPTPPANGTDWYTDPDYANAPVLGVDWTQAQTYCGWIQGSLPTEAQWEKAARGTEARTYPWGEDIPTCALANYEDCQLPPAPELIRSFPLGASPYYVADMAGNAAEWVNDWYGEDYYTSAPQEDPTGPDTGLQRGVRGGSFLSAPNELANFLRSALDPDQTREDLGFRCVITDEVAGFQGYPPCQVLGYSPIPPNIGPGITLPETPNITLDAFCNIDNQFNPYGTASIVVDQPYTASNVIVTSPQGALNCTVDNNNPQLLNCLGAAIHPGSQFTINVCTMGVQYISPAPDCPWLYEYNPVTQMCEYNPEPLMNCPLPFIHVQGYGCLLPPVQDECPVGQYLATYNGDQVCVPAAGPGCCQPGQPCAYAYCPEGMIFNEGNFCCDYPQDAPPACPQGFTLDPNTGFCNPPMVPDICASVTVTVPTCGSTPGTGCWITVTTGGAAGAPVQHLECVSPCPPDANPGGLCTP